MKKNNKSIIKFGYIVLPVCLVMGIFLLKFTIAFARTDLKSNIEKQNYGPSGDREYSETCKSFIVKESEEVIVTFQAGDNSSYLVKYYDKSFNEKSSKQIDMELNLFGSLYYDGNNYYILSGQENPDEKSTVECFRLTKYDKKWKRIASVGLYNCNTVEPFACGNARMEKVGKYLLIKTSHDMYKRSWEDVNHQANLMFQVDTENMSITDSATSMSGLGGYASHSFDQYVLVDNNKMVALDVCDSIPFRGIRLLYGSKDLSKGSFVEAGGGIGNVEIEEGQTNGYDFDYILYFDGDKGDNYVGASVGGFECSSSSYITVGNSVTIKGNKNEFLEPVYSNEKNSLLWDSSNIFVSVVDKKTRNEKKVILTNYQFGDEGASTPQLVKINDNKFAVLWSRDETVYYTYIDGQGNVLSDTYSKPGFLTDCKPIVVDDSVVWFEYYGQVKDRPQYRFMSIPTNVCNEKHSWKEDKETWLHWQYLHYDKLLKVKTCKKCQATETTVVSTCKSHVWDNGKTLKEANCIKDGEIEYTCKNCGYKRKSVIYKNNNHKWDDGIITKNPTINEYGEKKYTCSVCGETSIEYLETLSKDECVEAFVTRIYQFCLERAPEENGIDYWTNKILYENYSGSYVGAGFVFSKEYMDRGTTNSSYITMLYRVFMDREPENDGLNYWMNQIRQGTSREQVFKGFIDSAEYSLICNSYGINKGEYTIQGIPDPVIKEGVITDSMRAYVERLYECALGRSSEAEGSEYWCKIIANQIKTPVQVAEEFIMSAEFEQKGLDNTEYIKVLYRTFLGREADDVGFVYWKQKMELGESRLEILEEVAMSEEFGNIVKSFGL